MTARRVEVVVEVTDRRAFASALEWPGWTRGGRTASAAVEALASYSGRYAPVAAAAGHPLPPSMAFVVVEELEGDATTTFGAPSQWAAAEQRPCAAAVAARAAALLEAAWAALDAVHGQAPALLRKGPRGGGRDRDAIYEHVLGAERAYAAKLGVRQRQPRLGDTAAITALRGAMLTVVGADRSGEPAAERGWPPRYAARRSAWHALDHAWEIEDRA
ncbi:MAG: hypothetical protein ACYDAC_00765 [Candidatus Dormibacteria bacterium]